MKLQWPWNGTRWKEFLLRYRYVLLVVAVENLSPSFRGALVVCPGGDDPAIQWKILQAVSALTGLGSDRICVCGGGNS